jgi:ABC-type multidrug transport system permease subunit
MWDPQSLTTLWAFMIFFNITCYLLHAGFFLDLFFDTEEQFQPNFYYILNGLHGVISQKIEVLKLSIAAEYSKLARIW